MRTDSFTVWLKRLTCVRVELQLLLERALIQRLQQEQFERFDPDVTCKPPPYTVVIRP